MDFSLWFHSIIFTYRSWAVFVGVHVTCFIFSGATVIGTGFTPLVSACSWSVCVTDCDSGDSLMHSRQIGQPCWTHLLHACVLSRFSRVQLFVTLWTVAHQAPVSMEFSRQEYWSGFPFPSQEIFSTQGLNPSLPRCRQVLYLLSHLGSPKIQSHNTSQGVRGGVQKWELPALDHEFFLQCSNFIRFLLTTYIQR